MKYIIRILAILPALSVGIALVLLFAIAFDYPYLVLLLCPMAIAFVILLDRYEDTVVSLRNLIALLINN